MYQDAKSQCSFKQLEALCQDHCQRNQGVAQLASGCSGVWGGIPGEWRSWVVLLPALCGRCAEEAGSSQPWAVAVTCPRSLRRWAGGVVRDEGVSPQTSLLHLARRWSLLPRLPFPHSAWGRCLRACFLLVPPLNSWSCGSFHAGRLTPVDAPRRWHFNLLLSPPAAEGNSELSQWASRERVSDPILGSLHLSNWAVHVVGGMAGTLWVYLWARLTLHIPV